jgi:Cdc6-like AAA superfamily ATPase
MDFHLQSRLEQLTRFERIGLKWNPFRTVAAHEKADIYLPDLYQTVELARRVAESREPFIQVIADAGHGKSTVLAAVGDTLAKNVIASESKYLQPSLLTRAQIPDREVRVLILDEAERLTRRNLRNLIRWTERGGRLIVSSHRDLYGRAYGRSASRNSARRDAATIRLPNVTATGLQEFFRARVRWAASSEHFSELTTDGASWLLDASHGNLRIVEAILYEIFQAEAESNLADPQSSTSCRSALRIDARHLEKYSELAKDQARFEAAGNIPYNRLQLVVNAARVATNRTVALLSGQLSTPDPVEHELPNED